MIQIETGWLLLIPIFFGLGWLASRWDLRLEARQDERERLKQQRSTFKGLNLLLTDAVLYERLKQNCRKAAEQLNWQEEEKILISFYKHILE